MSTQTTPSQRLVYDASRCQIGERNSYYCNVEHPVVGGIIISRKLEEMIELIANHVKVTRAREIFLNNPRPVNETLNQLPTSELQTLARTLRNYFLFQNITAQVYLPEERLATTRSASVSEDISSDLEDEGETGPFTQDASY